jgi:hypothetical protein
LSVCRKAEATILSISTGKSLSSRMNFGKWLQAKSAACFPPCPSNTWPSHWPYNVTWLLQPVYKQMQAT